MITFGSPPQGTGAFIFEYEYDVSNLHSWAILLEKIAHFMTKANVAVGLYKIKYPKDFLAPALFSISVW